MRISEKLSLLRLQLLFALALCSVVKAAEPGIPLPAQAAPSSQKVGSVLFYNLYSSDGISTSPLEETEINLTNTSPTIAVSVRLYFVNGRTGASRAEYFCLAPNQTISLLASQVDPGMAGYVLAVAVNATTGCPVSHNFLAGDAYIKLGTGHSARLNAISIAALYSGQLASCAGGATTATLSFDGNNTGYNQVPRTLALNNLPSRADGNDSLLIINRVGGNLISGANRIGTVTGKLFDDQANEADFIAPALQVAQFRASLGSTFLNNNPAVGDFIPGGQTGWLKFAPQCEVGLLGATINRNANATASAGAFDGGYNLSALTIAARESYVIPIAPSGCVNRPTLTEVDPGSTAVGGQSFTLTVRGTGFMSGARVMWNGQDRGTAFVNSRQLTAQIPASDFSAANRGTVTVVNPGAGSIVSNALTFLAISQGTESEPNEQSVQATSISPISRFSGAAAVGNASFFNITYPDGSSDGIEDLFAVTLTRNAYLDLRLNTTNGSADFDLFLLRESGTNLTIIDLGATPNSNEQISTANPLPPGRYLIGVSAFSGSSSYSLTVMLQEQSTTSIPMTAAVSAASYAGCELSPESIVAAFGSDLSNTIQTAPTVPLPTELAGTRVVVTDGLGTNRDAPLFFVSPGQINYLIPMGTSLGAATVSIVRGGQIVAVGTMQISAVAPGLFTANFSGQGVPSAQALRIRSGNLQYEPIARFDSAQQIFVATPIDLGPAGDQVYLVLYGTGLRRLSSPTAATLSLSNGFESRTLPASYAGPAPGFVGLDQVNVLLPRSLIGFGETEITLTIDGKQANKVRVNIR